MEVQPVSFSPRKFFFPIFHLPELFVRRGQLLVHPGQFLVHPERLLVQPTPDSFCSILGTIVPPTSFLLSSRRQNDQSHENREVQTSRSKTNVHRPNLSWTTPTLITPRGSDFPFDKVRFNTDIVNLCLRQAYAHTGDSQNSRTQFHTPRRSDSVLPLLKTDLSL